MAQSPNPSLFEGLSYDEAVALVVADSATTDRLRERIRDDEARDRIEALSDSEILRALQLLRIQHTRGLLDDGEEPPPALSNGTNA
jgi:hypothetical protein